LRDRRLDDDFAIDGIRDVAALVRLFVQLRVLLGRRRRAPSNETAGRSVTRVIASLPSARFSSTPTASS
jgi:hypothetical protein